MYTMATLQLGQALGLPFLAGIAGVFVYVALAAWLATFSGVLARLFRLARPKGLA
jgi:hypothetical protein